MSTSGKVPDRSHPPWDPRPRPRIGLTLMTDEPQHDNHLPRYGMNRVFFEAIRRAGGVPIPLVPGPPEEMDLYGAPDATGEGASFLDGLCLTAGGDPDPSFFGQQPIPQGLDIDLERDRSELHLLELVRECDLPILGVCRGIQMMNIACGGDLIQDIATGRPAALKHDYFPPSPRDYLAHEIRIAEKSLLRELLGAETMDVNSLHHQALDRVAEGWIATAWAPDGIVEAIEPDPARGDASRRQPFLLGVQFHPEDLQALAPMRRIFAALVDAARQYRARRSTS